MKNAQFFVFGILLMLLAGACQKETIDYTEDENDYLIFGKYYGECMGDCVHLFRLTDTQLFQDDQDWGIPDEVPFLTTPLDNSRFELAKDLLASFPEDLKNSSQNTYGCPDCADQGGFYFELMENGLRSKWHIDVWNEGQTTAIISYKTRVDAIMNEL